MRIALTIGHTQLLLPDDKHLSAIMTALSAGVEIHWYEHGCEAIRTTGRGIQVSATVVRDDTPVEIRRDLYGSGAPEGPAATCGQLSFPAKAAAKKVKRIGRSQVGFF